MSLTVRPITAAEHLAFIEKQQSVSFLQTPAWARVKTEWRSESVGWFDSYRGGAVVGAALVLHRPVPKLPRYTLAYLPEGPVIDWSGDLEPWLSPLATYLKSNGAFGIRIGPPVATALWSAAQVKDGITDDATQRLSHLTPTHRDAAGARVVSQLRRMDWRLQSPEDGFGAGQPQYTFEVPLVHPDGRQKTEDEVLKGMNQLWRRNIKKATKMGVEVSVATPAKPAEGSFDADLSAFHGLYVHTAERDHFTPRGRRYFETMFAAMSAEDPERIKLFLARHEGDLVAATILVRVGRHAWYSYGASSTEKRDVRGSNALQWAMIQDSLASGAAVYDLRGITPTLSADDSHVGLIQFKVGTGGQAVEYAGEWDLPLNKALYSAFDLYMKRR
ncbi:MAG: peptidoglycan bridge formation glycyltransferase FemA/FemB family protein [Nocardioides sp.]|nr:peptidoglycan bridge formation glycyltransferase FemA/FemB family protein [Nocardioides sp.]